MRTYGPRLERETGTNRTPAAHPLTKTARELDTRCAARGRTALTAGATAALGDAPARCFTCG